MVSDPQENNEILFDELGVFTGELLLAHGTLKKIFDLACDLTIFASTIQGLQFSKGAAELSNDQFADSLVPLIQSLIERCVASIPIDVVMKYEPLQKYLFKLLSDLESIVKEFNMNIPVTFPEGMTMQ